MAIISRRDLLSKASAALPAMLGATAVLAAEQPQRQAKADRHLEKDYGEDESPTEDLMKEHGLLNRVLLVYDHVAAQIEAKQTVDLSTVLESRDIIREFIENYHEKNEETHIFPRLKKANKLTGLIDTLLAQHQAGRHITDELLAAVNTKNLSQVHDYLRAFTRMYRPHEAREDTVVFQEFRNLVPAKEFDELGDLFEADEYKRFGANGFQHWVDKIAGIERKLGIYELAQFTPRG